VVATVPGLVDLTSLIVEHAVAEIEQQVPKPRGSVEITAGSYAVGERRQS
jgi:hypothetical protein